MSTETKAQKKPRRKIDRPRLPGSPLTVEQAAGELNLAPRTVRKRISEGKLRAYKDGRAVRITEADLAEYRAVIMGRPEVAPMAAVGTGQAIRRHLRPGRGAGRLA